ncbi:hypothetical protein ACSBR2_039374 [Camellia fascicularis]
MLGLGKTALPKKVYNDPYITHYFHIRAWTYVSQVPKKREMLLNILHSINLVIDEKKVGNYFNGSVSERKLPCRLIEIGKQIMKKCEGLPLTIVVIVGLLAKNKKTEECCKQVSQSVSSYIVSDPNQYLDTLAMSYNHLPHHLKPCFLYLGAFLED